LNKAFSTVDAFTEGRFQEVIDDALVTNPSGVKRVLLCSGKLYYDLLDYKTTNERHDIALVRLEQLYPLPIEQLQVLRQRYGSAQWIWVQEEPRNMGAASYLKMQVDDRTFPMGYLTRSASASTATGFAKKHAEEQKALVEGAFSN
jgi:2-oxoglutarate dehydrogenase E1 component